jgi:hypothetical protein
VPPTSGRDFVAEAVAKCARKSASAGSRTVMCAAIMPWTGTTLGPRRARVYNAMVAGRGRQKPGPRRRRPRPSYAAEVTDEFVETRRYMPG